MKGKIKLTPTLIQPITKAYSNLEFHGKLTCRTVHKYSFNGVSVHGLLRIFFSVCLESVYNNKMKRNLLQLIQVKR